MDSDNQRGTGVTRRAFVSAVLAAPFQRRHPPAADVTLNIERAQIEVAPGRTIITPTYNGTAPGPLIRMREGVPRPVEIVNHTDAPEYVHWHGFDVPAELDGTQEEGSRLVPAGGHLRYEITPTA